MKKLMYTAAAAMMVFAVSCGGNHDEARKLADLDNNLSTKQIEQALEYMTKAQKSQEDLIEKLGKYETEEESENAMMEATLTDFGMQQKLANQLLHKVAYSVESSSNDKLKDRYKTIQQKDEELSKKDAELDEKFSK